MAWWIRCSGWGLLLGLVLLAPTTRAETPTVPKLPGLPASPPLPLAPAQEAPVTALAEPNGWQSDGDGLVPYKDNYLLVARETTRRSPIQQEEIKFQFSLKKRLLADLYFGYTQLSLWQAFDKQRSAPFRASDYNPEVFYDVTRAFKTSQFGGRVGFEHQSNGQSGPDSRSWNRTYVQPDVNFGPLYGALKVWYRWKERPKETPTSEVGDNNPDIEDYLGRSELRLAYPHNPRTLEYDAMPYKVSLMGRYGLKHGLTWQADGELQLQALSPWFSQGTAIRLQYFTGYGETLLDYNQKITKWAVGFSFR